MAVGCGSESDATESAVVHDGDGPAIVQATNMEFSPHTIVIGVGDTVEWFFNDGPIEHNVVGVGDSAPQDFASPMVALDSWSYTFTEAGEYDYVCTIHPQKTGRVIVE
ncbi:copper-binding protein [Hoyosella rhizosphaerae]|uniref:Blue (type 1) copper domain-containing protein n=1 Tax=Hoyosella rhizosphaerae TaxID=1755582 RepID=A0A916XDK0_9ACTN|nr:plastocyanin/azurin family copper-binding protein [Hoyosella rhizosphaerae]MBN4926077.1 copper-binding protein [Hoyosella rhizosphaerae]GGC65747.1 hypothetical protein GCM10011410_17830 [Hoyosella rhizosphaerae]